jgi:mannose-6-phosphate isomerase-like protein (cupin superfamily)
MQIRTLDRANLTHENGLHAQRLLPWPLLNAPFEGSWCVIAPGTASTPHAHHEYEIFIAISGNALVECDGEPRAFRPGDVVHFRPGERHSVINDGEEDFQFYSVWWDADMTRRFVARHPGES